jgi:hypothetical protein
MDNLTRMAYRLIIEAVEESQGRNIHPGTVSYQVSLLVAGMRPKLQAKLVPAMLRAHEILREGK